MCAAHCRVCGLKVHQIMAAAVKPCAAAGEASGGAPGPARSRRGGLPLSSQRRHQKILLSLLPVDHE